MKDKSFIEFIEIPDRKTKTKNFYIRDNVLNILGYVNFFPQWRKYVFTPVKATVVIFDSNCLREIADFTEKQTNEWKETIKKEKMEM